MDEKNFDSDTELYDLIRNYNSDDLRLVLSKVGSLTVLNTFKICNDNTKKILSPYISEYETEDFVSHLDRLGKHISIEDCIKAKNTVCDIAKRYNFNKESVDSEDIPFVADQLAGYYLYEIIPKNISLDYNSFISAYYEILWLLYICYNTSKRCGLLEISNIPFYLKESDYILMGLTLTVDGADTDELSPILFNHIKREHNAYKRALKQVSAEGILGLNPRSSYEYDNADKFIVSLIKSANIQDEITLNACKEYKGGNTNAFKELFRKDSALYNKMNQTIEREEITFIRKALKYLDKACREGLESIKDYLDEELISKKDMFEYGLSLMFKGVDGKMLKTTLECELGKNANIISRDLYLAQIDAVLSIQRGDNPRILLALLLSHFEDDISDLACEIFKDYF
jgi:flagellar motor component MotA